MARIALILLLSWVFGYSAAFAVDIKTTNGPGGWQRDRNLVRLQNPATDVLVLDNFSTSSGLGFPHVSQSASLEYTAETAAFELLTTSGVYHKVSSYDDGQVFGNISVSPVSGVMTVLTGGEGDYIITTTSSVRLPFGANMGVGIFKNDAVIDEEFREMTTGPQRLPTFANVSSDGSDAAFGAQSSLSYLLASDGDDLIVVESGIGSTGCFFLNVGVGLVDIPFRVNIGTSAYSSNNSNHWANVRLLNYSTGLLVDLNEATKDYEDVGLTLEPFERISWSFAVPLPERSYVLGGMSELQIYHNDVSCAGTHEFRADQISITDKVNSIPIATQHIVPLIAGDAISMGFKSSIEDSEFFRNNTELTIHRIGE